MDSDALAALEERAGELGERFPRCILLVLSHGEPPGVLGETLRRIPPRLAALFLGIAVLAESDSAQRPLGLPELPGLSFHANPRRYGWGGRRKVALEFALARGADLVILLEADGTQPPERLAELWEVALREEAGVVVASGGDGGAGPRLLNAVLGLRLRCWSSGLRLYAARVLRRVPFQVAADGRRFDTELLVQARALGEIVREVPVTGLADGRGFAWREAWSAALDYRLHQLHTRRSHLYLVDRDVHYTLKRSPFGSHMQILGAIPAGARVLDLGCSQGLLARPLREKGARVTGVDLHPPEAVSRELEAYHRRDLEEPLEIPEGRVFDRVVLSDVIEHVRNREQLLRSARRYLKPEGRLLVSTPNVALWFYRLSLLLGRFEYGPRGVLDETHVHLYTLATFRREVERGGFRVLRVRTTALPFEVVFESTGRSHLVAALSRVYHLLTRAENAFRCMKSPLAERPIFHQLERRVETHIFLCVLAYHLLVAIEKRLLDQGVHTSWASVRDTLSTHQVATIVLPTDDGSLLRIRKASTPEPEHKELYRLLGVSETIVRPKKTWTEATAAK